MFVPHVSYEQELSPVKLCNNRCLFRNFFRAPLAAAIEVAVQSLLHEADSPAYVNTVEISESLRQQIKPVKVIAHDVFIRPRLKWIWLGV